MADAAEVAVLLLNFRQPGLTRQCLADLVVVREPRTAVLVIDNGSGDDSVPELERAIAELSSDSTGPEIELLALPDNLGFAGGMNRGIEWAAERDLSYCVVLNNDVRLSAEVFRPLRDVLQNDPRVAAVAPTMLRADGRVWAEGGSTGFGPNALRLHRQGLPPRRPDHGPVAVDFLPCACVMFRTSDLRAVSGFDAGYFMYWEDVDLCARLRARGGRIVSLPWVRIEHRSGGSSGGGRSALRKYLMAAHALRYLRRHGNAKAWLGWFLFDVLLWPITLLTGPRAAFAKLAGTFAGIRGRAVGAADVERRLGGGA
ncbi:MAG: glycosyltransferase [bacterium]|nr:glycosyltransferase [bacterium]